MSFLKSKSFLVGSALSSLYFLPAAVKNQMVTYFTDQQKLEGKTIIVTGANSGVGRATVEELAKKRGRVIMACRNMEECHSVRKNIVLSTRNRHVVCRELDLSSFESIRKFAANINLTEPNVDILINNAGVYRGPRVLTKDGIEQQIGINHFGHFLLTMLLLDKLKASPHGRIVNVSSVASVKGHIKFEDLNSDQSYKPGEAYSQSKLANILFTKELGRRLQGSNIDVNAVHPGIVSTNIGRNVLPKSKVLESICLLFAWPFLRTPLQGAQTVLYAALSTDLDGVSGKYLDNCKEKKPIAEANDDKVALRLWLTSEKWTRLAENLEKMRAEMKEIQTEAKVDAATMVTSA